MPAGCAADFPENPVGKVLELLRTVYMDFDEIELPEIIDFADARKSVGDDPLYVGQEELHRVDERRILRYDLTLPLLLTARWEGRPLKLWSAGKTYRLGHLDAMHLEAFHQAEIFYLDERSRLDPWRVTAQALHAVDVMLPDRYGWSASRWSATESTISGRSTSPGSPDPRSRRGAAPRRAPRRVPDVPADLPSRARPVPIAPGQPLRAHETSS